ncbi:nitrate transporter [Wolfiporia cocos MD-104 SS10]|uniref:Nitrate/nitrite transporter n=1 Tax=Wolfiporia cocos (strain MD-104) TaxID=742152 RepID=A0A2H3J5U1_WOLCO|nr:nitrate transporter [Wolfiporia cocos MD-104 SS10]
MIWKRLTKLRVNPVNRRCTNLPLLAIWSPYIRNFHLSWLGFWVAFLSWFAFSPLIPQAVKSDLKLTNAQIANSNIVSLCSTLVARVAVGPLVDLYGPRKVMAGILVIGAIPSGLAGTIDSASGLYIVRFFIGFLGATFVPCQAWTSVFFDTGIVGRANALTGGWGNAGGGFTFIIMLAVYNQLCADGLSNHVAWRASFAIAPVPILLAIAGACLLFGTDHPNGHWKNRNDHAIQAHTDQQPGVKNDRTGGASQSSAPAAEESMIGPAVSIFVSATEVDVAVNENPSLDIVYKVITSHLTWLPSLAYLSTFGFELAMDATLANVLYDEYKSRTFGQTKAGYIAAIYGLNNVYSRPLGGYLGDLIYRRYGVPGKKYLTLGLGIMQGILAIALGVYVDSREHSSLAAVIPTFIIMAIFNQAANGANFSLVPHCNPNSNGIMTGIVGAMGNLGGVFFALIFRMQPTPAGKAFWISGCVAIERCSQEI